MSSRVFLTKYHEVEERCRGEYIHCLGKLITHKATVREDGGWWSDKVTRTDYYKLFFMCSQNILSYWLQRYGQSGEKVTFSFRFDLSLNCEREKQRAHKMANPGLWELQFFEMMTESIFWLSWTSKTKTKSYDPDSSFCTAGVTSVTIQLIHPRPQTIHLNALVSNHNSRLRPVTFAVCFASFHSSFVCKGKNANKTNHFKMLTGTLWAWIWKNEMRRSVNSSAAENSPKPIKCLGNKQRKCTLCQEVWFV